MLAALLLAALPGDQGRSFAALDVGLERNVLVIVGDDIGADDLEVVMGNGRAPSLEQLGIEGVVFPNAYAQPTCSPTRDGILTSRWGGKLNGKPCDGFTGMEPPLELVTVADLARAAGLATATFGKWHLGAPADGISPLEDAAALQGFDFWCGAGSNLEDCDDAGYSSWYHVHGGTRTHSTAYAPRVYLDDFRAWWTSTEQPRFAIFNSHLAHAPMHRPPAEELPADYPDTETGTLAQVARARFEAMIATLDRHVAEILEVVDPATTLVIFLGDNGTPANVAPPGFAGKAKGTSFDRGIHVPCIVRCPGVAPGVLTRMVSNVDVLPTVAEFLGVQAPLGIEGVSMGAAPNVRAFTKGVEYFTGAGGQLPSSSNAYVRTPAYKYMIVNWHRPPAQWDERFYNLLNDPNETKPLGPSVQPAVQAALRQAVLEALPD